MVMIVLRKSLPIRRTKKYRKLLVPWIPSFFTFANALLGMLSIIKTLDGDYRIAAYCIIGAAFMDACDGRIARALGTTSYFGMELDSLSDAISFCLAPTILLYSWLPYTLSYQHLILLGLYLCAGLGRLAHFNTTHQKQTNLFKGLPTTVAAFFIASLIVESTKIQQSFLYPVLSMTGISILISVLAYLMISPLPFPSAKRYSLSNKLNRLKLMIGLSLCIFCIIKGYPLFFLLITSYILGALSIALYKQMPRRHKI